MVSTKQLSRYFKADMGYTKAYNAFKKANPGREFIRKKRYEALKNSYVGRPLTPVQQKEYDHSPVKPRNALYKKGYDKLSDEEKETRCLSLEVLKEARKAMRNLSFERLPAIAKAHDISVNTVLMNTRAFVFQNNEWLPKENDDVPRQAPIIVDGKLFQVNCNYKDASTLGHYFNDVKKYLRNEADASIFEKYEGVTVRDIDTGHTYTLDTDCNSIEGAMSSREDEEWGDFFGS